MDLLLRPAHEGSRPSLASKRRAGSDKSEKSTKMLMFSFFFTKRGHLSYTIVPRGKTVNSYFYRRRCLVRAFAACWKIRPKFGFRGMRLHHDNASAHTAVATAVFAAETRQAGGPHTLFSRSGAVRLLAVREAEGTVTWSQIFEQ